MNLTLLLLAIALIQSVSATSNKKSTDNPYQILKLSYPSTRQQIRKAFKQLSLQYHPDRNPSENNKYQKIIAAYQQLKHIGEQKQQEASEHRHNSQYVDLEDILNRVRIPEEELQRQKKGKPSFLTWCYINPKIVFAAFLISLGIFMICK